MKSSPGPGSCLARRVVFPEPGRVELEELAVDLDGLGAHEVVVCARRSVISPGTELAHYRGDPHAGVLSHARPVGEPFHPGYAMAATVVAAGAECGLAIGTEVLAHTPHQSLARFDTRRRVCVPTPPGLTADAVPFGRLVQVGAVSLQLATAQPGDLVAVVGLGPVGNLVAQLAQSCGYRVVAVERSPGRRELAARCGLRQVVEPAAGRDAVGPGASLVLECSGSQHGVILATELCQPHAEVFTVGAPWRPEPEVAASSVVARVFEQFLALRSGWEWQVPLHGVGRSIASCTRWVLDVLAAAGVVTAPLVSGRLAPAEAATAYHRLDEDPEHHFTFLLDWEAS